MYLDILSSFLNVDIENESDQWILSTEYSWVIVGHLLFLTHACKPDITIQKQFLFIK